MTIHHWGITKDKLKEVCKWEAKDPQITFGPDYVQVGTVTVRNFPSDCGAVQLAYINYVNTREWEIIKTYCSKSGYSLILGTLVDYKTEESLAKLKSFGFKVGSKGKSNRNKEKKHYLLYNRITCDKKGY